MKGITKMTALTIITLMIATCAVTITADANHAATGNWSDGTYADESWYDVNKSEFTLEDTGDLAGLTTLVNEGNNFENKTIDLVAGKTYDISEHEWTPIGTGTRSGSGITDESKTFNGTFNGNGATINGLTITGTSTNADDAVGFFGIVSGGTVDGLVFANVSINVSNSEMAGAVVGMMVNGATVQNCTVGSDSSDDTSSVTASRGNGGIVGRMTISGTIKGCTNYADIEAKGTNGNTGGIVGAAYYTETGLTMTISDCHNYGVVKSAGMGVGGIVGLSAANISDCSNNADVSGTGTSIGGIVGEQKNYGTLVNCTNSNKVSNGSSIPGESDSNPGGMGTGGIIGWIRYSGNDTQYPLSSTIVLINCDNSGDVTSQSTHNGGIVGAVYHSVEMTDCDNTGSVTGQNFIGGLIGGMQTVDEFHPDDGCRLLMVDNSTTGTVSGGAQSGGALGHFSSANDSVAQKCDIPNESNWTVYGNTISSTSSTGTIGIDSIESVVIATVDGNEFGYTKLQDAVKNAPNEATINLLSDVTESIVVDNGKSVTIDLNGHTITNSDTPAENETENHTIINRGTLTIKDSAGKGMIDNITHGRAAIYNLGTTTMESGTATRSKEASVSSSDNGGNSWYVVFNAGTFNMNGGTITQDGHYSSLFINRSVNDSKPVMKMTGGTLQQDGFIALKNEEDGNVEITGGDVISSDEQSMQNWGTATVSGGKLTGTVISLSYSTADGQNFKATTNIDSGTVEGDIWSWKFTNGSTPAAESPAINVTGGTVDGSFKAIQGASSDKSVEVEFKDSGIKVSGGTFTNPVPEDCVDDGTILVPTGNGTYDTITTDDATIKGSGTVVTTIESEGSSYVLTSNGSYEDVTVTIQFPDGSIVINGGFQKGAYTVILEKASQLVDGMEAGFRIYTNDIRINSITVTVDVDVDDGYRMTSATVYHQADGSTIDTDGFEPDSFTEDGTVVFTTNTNSYYWIDAVFEAISTTPDYPSADDDEDLPPVIRPGASSSSDDDTVTIVACAAAAVVAALMAVFLIVLYRKD